MRKTSWTKTGRRMLGVSALIGAALGIAATSGCDSQRTPSKPAEKALTGDVYTTFYPTAYFAQRIAGEHVTVVNPCPPDADPAYWMPDEQAIAAYQQAALIVINGASFEHWLPKVTLPESRIVDTTKPLHDQLIELKNKVVHSHGPAGTHSHAGIDGHTWLDPINAKLQATEIMKALVERFPEHAGDFKSGFDALAADLSALDARFKAVTEKLGDQRILCNHPAYNYIGRRYGWHLTTFHLDPDEMIGQQALDKIKASLGKHPARYMLWEAPPIESIVEQLSALGLKAVVFSPVEALGADELARGADYLSEMTNNAQRLEQALAD